MKYKRHNQGNRARIRRKSKVGYWLPKRLREVKKERVFIFGRKSSQVL